MIIENKSEDTSGDFEPKPLKTPEEKETPETPAEKTEDKSTEEKTPEGDKTPEDKSTDRQPTAQEFKAVDGARKHFEDLAKDQKTEIEELKSQVSRKDESTEDRDKRVDFLLTHREFTQVEFDHIATVAQRKGTSLEDAAESEKGYTNYQREKVAKEKKIPESSSPGGVSKKFTSKELEDMKDEEFKEYEKQQREERKTGI